MAARKIVHLSVEQRRARGKEVRDQQKDAKAVKRAEKTGQKSIAKAHARDRLAASMAAAANVDALQAGVERTKEALVECRRGDYPGGGQGVLSLPFARPSARTDHCWR